MFKLVILQLAAFTFVLDDSWLNIYDQMKDLQEAVTHTDSVFHSVLEHSNYIDSNFCLWSMHII